jgi:hypothetical protein
MIKKVASALSTVGVNDIIKAKNININWQQIIIEFTINDKR